jgi:hypothetical protein
MKPKENFIKKMHFFFNVEYNEFTTTRIERWLDEYTEEIDTLKLIAKEKLEQVQRNKKKKKSLLKSKVK